MASISDQLKFDPDQIYTLGPKGTFSDKAAQNLNKNLKKEKPLVYTRTISEVLMRAEAESRSLGVFPIENSVAGTVGQAQDSMSHHRLTVLAEINIPVRYSLLANAPLQKVEQFYAHPQAYDQCSEYLAANLPQAQVFFSNSNTDSGAKMLDDQGKGPVGAIVPLEFGENHKNLVMAEDIQDYPNNTTRFLVVRRAEATEHHDFSRQKTSLLIEPNDDRPGLLHELLSIFNRYSINLCRLESRPAKTTPWAYLFYIDIRNNEGTEQCLNDLEKTPNKITVLGSYDPL